MTIPTNNKKRLNITLTGDYVDLMEKLQIDLNDELKMKLSMAQVIKRLVLQATATK